MTKDGNLQEEAINTMDYTYKIKDMVDRTFHYCFDREDKDTLVEQFEQALYKNNKKK